ncbi:tetratricopeptide repeat protein [Jannaschia donghaensis]|uniref:Thioredoxin C-1 n=1 Tax=Jannaschia donghaensis TaxID=420998 RepID=A0A0M6YHF0_9RHOB|nr:tetratricopeptide repeat protein [Jannaschia donghaensis]CTQ49380.1 Thioredoxin C-1 [Jannaschia donghaensis]
MIELGQPQTETAPTDLIRDVDEASFMADVVEASMTIPVIVDFWAQWCGPCKTLGPQLETAVTAAKGAVKMAKVDVDRNQQIAAQLQIQSIPTVYAFWQGKPVDGFQGAVSPAEVEEFVKRAAALGPGAEDDGLAEAVLAADEMLEAGEAEDALQTYAAVLGEEPENAGAYGGMIRAHLALDQIDEAEAMVDAAPAALLGTSDLEAARAQIALARQAANAGPVTDLTAAVEADADDHQARFDLAAALQADGQTEAAVDHLLELFRRDRDWNDGAARTQLFIIFDALKASDPIVLKGRRKLSSMIFA